MVMYVYGLLTELITRDRYDELSDSENIGKAEFVSSLERLLTKTHPNKK